MKKRLTLSKETLKHLTQPELVVAGDLINEPAYKTKVGCVTHLPNNCETWLCA